MPERFVLIHPNYKNPHFTDQWATWRIWEASPSTIIFADEDFPDNTPYIDGLPKGTTLVIGGQTAHVCIATHLRGLAMEERVCKGEISVVVSRKATWGQSSLWNGSDSLDEEIERINSTYGVSFTISNEELSPEM